jgi:photosystem I P700 chlorophyll a apoprotein A1
MQALGRPQDMFSDKTISFNQFFAQWIQGLHTAAPGTTSQNALATASYILVEILLF